MNKEEILKIIKEVEDKKIEVNSKSFYYAKEFDAEKYKSILTKGIEADFIKKDAFYDASGKYYITLTRNQNKYKDFSDSSYLRDINYSPLFIIDENIKAYKAKETSLSRLMLTNTRLPLRGSFYVDEYQVYKKISKDSIVGIEFLIQNIIERRIVSSRVIYEKSMVDILKELKNIVLLLEELKVDLPIYDYTENKEINKNKVLELVN